MPVTTDAYLETICPPLSADEYEQLEANILRDGCLDPLIVWPQEGALILIDGHNRYQICLRHDIPYTTREMAFADRDEAMEWMIAFQLGRRNLTAERKSYLRGKRYNLEKTKGHGTSVPHSEGQQTAKRLAEEYGVSHATIERDADFADAVDTLTREVRPDIRTTVLNGHQAGGTTSTKKQTMAAAKRVKERQVVVLPFMQREGWKPYQVLEAIDLLKYIPLNEHPCLNAILDEPFIPGQEGLDILRNLGDHTAIQRQHIYTLWHSNDQRERSLAKTLAAKKVPPPDPQVMFAGRLLRDMEAMRIRLKNWRVTYPCEPWVDELEALGAALIAIQQRVVTIAQKAEAIHQERITRHAEAFDA